MPMLKVMCAEDAEMSSESDRTTSRIRSLGPARRRIGTPARIVIFTSTLWVAAIAAASILAGTQQWFAGSPWPWWIQFPLLVLAFALTEVFVVHLHLRGDAHTFSMVEVPLAFGLLYADPLIVIGTHALGGALALAFHRRQPLLKLNFNAAVFAVSATVAVALFRLLAPEYTNVDTGVLLSAAAALFVANLVSLVLILIVIVMSSGRERLPAMWSGTRFGILTNLFTISLAIIALIVVDAQPTLAWLLAVPIGGTYLANWAYTTERRRHEGLDFLYQSTRLLHQSPELESAILGLLRHAQNTFGAKYAELVYWTGNGSSSLSIGVGPEGELVTDEHPDDQSQLNSLIQDLVGAHHFRVTELGPGAAFLADHGFRDAIVAPLMEDGRTVGALVIADQVSDVREFDDNDLRLAETLAGHTAVALENGHLEQSLEQLRILEGELSFQATHDPLTELANRSLFHDKLVEALGELHGARAVVLFIDLDDFKTVNDTLGHAAGDELLLDVAARLRACTRATDTVARLGGDEFAVLLPGVVERDDAEATADKILSALDTPTRISGRSVEIRASIGIAFATGDTDAATLMRNADTAMYQAKAAGKHRHVTFHPSMYESSLRRYNLHTDLRQALERNELCAHFQPILDLETGQVVAAEALVRWEHPTVGLLMPDTFLLVAAETGLIADLDMVVLDEACSWLAEIDHDDAGSVPLVNVNISPQSFREPGLTNRIRSALERHRIEPARLCIEVTEHLMAEDADHAIETLRELRAIGIRVALDDFGTGYSSLSHLRTLPIDTIKIPKPFVDDLDNVAQETNDQHAFVSAIIAISQALQKRVVAEGIERPDQLETLRGLGCHEGQGYLFARPMERAGIRTWLQNRRITSPGDASNQHPRI